MSCEEEVIKRHKVYEVTSGLKRKEKEREISERTYGSGCYRRKRVDLRTSSITDME